VKEAFYAKNTKGRRGMGHRVLQGPQQRFIMLPTAEERVRVIVRETLEEITSFGDGGPSPASSTACNSLASDSKGNIYTTRLRG